MLLSTTVIQCKFLRVYYNLRGASPKLGRGGQGDNISIDLSPTVKVGT